MTELHAAESKAKAKAKATHIITYAEAKAKATARREAEAKAKAKATATPEAEAKAKAKATATPEVEAVAKATWTIPPPPKAVTRETLQQIVEQIQGHYNVNITVAKEIPFKATPPVPPPIAQIEWPPRPPTPLGVFPVPPKAEARPKTPTPVPPKAEFMLIPARPKTPPKAPAPVNAEAIPKAVNQRPARDVALHPAVEGYVSSSEVSGYNTGGTETEARGISTPSNFHDTTDTQDPEFRQRYYLDSEDESDTDEETREEESQYIWNWWREYQERWNRANGTTHTPVYNGYTEEQWNQHDERKRETRLRERHSRNAFRANVRENRTFRHRFNLIIRRRVRARRLRQLENAANLIETAATLTNRVIEEIDTITQYTTATTEEPAQTIYRSDDDWAEEADDESENEPITAPQVEESTAATRQTRSLRFSRHIDRIIARTQQRLLEADIPSTQHERAQFRERHMREVQQISSNTERMEYLEQEAVIRNMNHPNQYNGDCLRADLTTLIRELDMPRSAINIVVNPSYMLWWPQQRRNPGILMTRMTHGQYVRRIQRAENRQIIDEYIQDFEEVQMRRVNQMFRPGQIYGMTDWRPTDEQIEAHGWVPRWRQDRAELYVDTTPGVTRRYQRNPPVTSPLIRGTYRQTPNVKEWREETIRAINLNAIERGTALLTGAPPGYTIEYESDHSSDPEDSVPTGWEPGGWHDKGTIGLRWRGSTPGHYESHISHACEVGEPIRINPRQLVQRDTDTTVLDELLERTLRIADEEINRLNEEMGDNPWAELR